MKHMVRRLVCLATVAGLSFGAFAEPFWDYDPAAGTLTERRSDELKPWVFTLSAAGSVTGISQQGAGTVLDFRQSAMPEGTPVIKSWGFGTNDSKYNYINKSEAAIPQETVYFPEAITSFGDFTIYCWKSMKYVTWPTNLTSIGSYAFEHSAIVDLVLPDTVRSIGGTAFNTTSPLKTVKMPAGLTSCGGDIFKGCGNLREITWPTWCGAWKGTSNAAWSDKNVRYIVPGSNATWMATIADRSMVTYWGDLSESDRNSYTARYGAEAATPYGLSVSGMLPGGVKQTWIVVTEAKPDRAYIHVTSPSSEYGTLSLDPKPDADGTWAEGTQVHVAFSTADGVSILGWSGNVPAGCERDSDFTIMASGTKALLLSCKTDSYTYSDGKLSDGSVTLSVSGNETAGWTVTKLEAVGPDGLVDLTQSIDVGGTVVAIGDNAFQNNVNVKRVIFPDDLKSIGQYAFQGCYKLESVEPFLPRGLTSLKYRAFSGCSSITNGAEIGFGTNETTRLPISCAVDLKEDRNCYLFPSCGKIPYVKWGPGVVEVPRESSSNMSSLTNLEYSANTTIVREFYTTGCGKLATVTCLATNTMTFSYKGASSCFPSSVREIVWNGWYETAGGSTMIGAWTDKNCRFIVPGDNLTWLNFIADSVTPWKDLDAATQQYYWDRYGTDAKEPVGLSAVVPGRHNRTWIVKTDVQLSGCMLVLPSPSAVFGTVTVSPAPREEDGMYAPGTEVTVTFAPQPGVTFTRWTGDVSDENAVKPSFTFAIEDMTTIGLQFDAGFFHFENGLLTDGVQSFKATKSDAGYAVSGATAMRTDGLLDLDKSDAEGLGIVSIGTGAFSGNTAITRLVLPDGLQSLGSTAFKSCSKIVDVVNFLPRGLTWIGNESFGGCSSITNAAWIGYGTNDLGEAISVKMDNSSSGDRNSCLFNGCSKLPAVHYGPGVVTVERYAVNSCSSLREIEMSVNTITNREYYSIASGITNVICLATNVMNFTCQNQGTFNGCGSLRQIVFNGWFNIACGGTFMTVSDKNCRFVVPGDNMDWLGFIGDGTRVEPWANLSDADRTYYTNRYGKDENLVPCGLTYAVGGQYGRVWVVKTKVQLAGCPLTVTRPNAAFGTLTVTPEPSAETGLYAPGTEVTVSIASNEGVRFLGWLGDVTEEDAGKTSLTFEINEPMSLTPQLLADFMVYEGGFLTDGTQNYKASGAANAIQLDGVVTTLSNGVVDVTKPIVGGTLTKIKDMFCNWCDASTKFTIREMYLPETITYFGARAFDCSTIIKTVEPLFPRDVTYVGYSIFAGATALKGNVTIGYATDEQGRPKTVSFGKYGGDNRSFLNIGAIYSVRLGPGVRTAPQGLIDSAGATTNIVIDGVAAMEGSVFKGLGKCDVTFTSDMPTWTSVPFSLASNKSYLQRYYLPWEGGKKFPLWGAYLKDETKVKPWKALTRDEKALYRAKFPNEPRSAHPFGLTLSGGILPTNQWVFAPYRAGGVLTVR